MLYLTRQAAEHPLSPGSLLYVLYVLYLTRQATEHLPGFLAICAICAIWPYIAHILQIFARTEDIAHIVHIARSWGRVDVQRAWRVRYSTQSTYSKNPGKSGGSAAWRVRYSTYSTYSKDLGKTGGSAAWRGFNAGRPGGAPGCQPDMLKQLGSDTRQVARQETLALSVEGVSQMVYILPEKLPALVRPAFDLVLRRIRSKTLRGGVRLQNRDP